VLSCAQWSCYIAVTLNFASRCSIFFLAIHDRTKIRKQTKQNKNQRPLLHYQLQTSSSLWVCLFYRKALRWFAMKVIFLVSLLQKSNKHKSNAIWVLQTLSFHFILFVSFTSLFAFKPQVEIFISWMQSRLKPLPEHTVLLCCSGSCDAGHFCLQWAEFRLPNKTTSEHTELWPTWQELHID